MKLPDTEILQPREYHQISDTWKLEWERGVQVPLDPDSIASAPSISVVESYPTGDDNPFVLPPDRLAVKRINV